MYFSCKDQKSEIDHNNRDAYVVMLLFLIRRLGAVSSVGRGFEGRAAAQQRGGRRDLGAVSFKYLG